MDVDAIKARLLAKRAISDHGCWEWTGSRFAGKPYGQIKIGSKNWRVHRLAYTVWVRPIPPGMTIDHVCRNGSCFNPDHLDEVTIRINTLRGLGPSAVNGRRKRCVNGHPLEGDNLLMVGDRRRCRTCAREAGRRHDLKRGWDKGDRNRTRELGRERTRRYKERKRLATMQEAHP